MLAGIVGAILMWNFFKDAENRAIIGGVVGFAWTVFLYFFPRPRKGWGGRLWASLQAIGGARWLRGVFWLSVLFTVFSFAYYVVIKVQPVVRVCEGQFEGFCSPHDVFVGCYGLPKMQNTCWHYKYLGNDGGRSGN